MTAPAPPENPYAAPPARPGAAPAEHNPYAAPNAPLDHAAPDAVTDLQYTGFWMRVLASIVDSILMAIVTTPLLIVIGLAVGSRAGFSGRGITPVGGLLEMLINWVLPAVIVVTFWIMRGATPGKMLISAKIVDAETGAEPSTGQYIGRYFGYFLSSIVFGLGLMWVGWDPRKQGWHDKLAGTVVVRPGSGDVPVEFPGA